MDVTILVGIAATLYFGYETYTWLIRGFRSGDGSLVFTGLVAFSLTVAGYSVALGGKGALQKKPTSFEIARGGASILFAVSAFQWLFAICGGDGFFLLASAVLLVRELGIKAFWAWACITGAAAICVGLSMCSVKSIEQDGANEGARK